MRSLKAEITECQAAVRSQRGKNNCRECLEEQEGFQACWGGSAEVAELDLLIHKPLGSAGIPLGSPSAGTCTLSSSSSICPGAGKLKRMEFFGFFFFLHKGKANCSFCGASADLFAAAVGTGKLRDALGLVRARFLLICVSWLPQLLGGT